MKKLVTNILILSKSFKQVGRNSSSNNSNKATKTGVFTYCACASNIFKIQVLVKLVKMKVLSENPESRYKALHIEVNGQTEDFPRWPRVSDQGQASTGSTLAWLGLERDGLRQICLPKIRYTRLTFNPGMQRQLAR